MYSKKKRRYFIWITLLFIIQGCIDDNYAVKEGNFSPDFQLTNLEHGRFFLNQQRGKFVILIFWATWCQQCKGALLELKLFIEKYKDKNVILSGICSDPENMDDVKKIVYEMNLNYPTLLDNSAKVFSKYKLRAFPAIILINIDGKIDLIRYGYNKNILYQIKKKLEL
ncbi:MAG: redoxin domain-containing protein [Desulfobacterales bacterium]|nr:redoxin domain-containing protein [Desulfobacterales bacterium]